MSANFLQQYAKNWWVLALYGLLGIVFGLVALTSPITTIAALMLIIGAFSLADGIISLFGLSNKQAAAPKWFMFIYALISIAFGLLAIIKPLSMGAAMIWVLGIWLVIAGIMRIILAIQVRKVVNNEWWLILSGVLIILLGMLFITKPLLGAAGIAIWIGAGALLFGILQIIASLRLRKSGLQA